VGQTDGHSSLDHATRSADVKWNSLGPHAGYPINASQWPHRVCVGPAWLNDRVSKKPSVKADLLIYSNCITVSG